MKPLTDFMEPLLRAWTGPLTSELVQTPGKFGLGRVPERLEPDAAAHSICGFCSTGCSLKVHLRDGQAINLSTNAEYPVNIGMACPKGWEALTPLAAPDRGIMPLVLENGQQRGVDWQVALDIFVSKIRGVQGRHGNEAVAFLSTGQIATEEMTFLGALAKFGMGMLHGDGNTRQCMATAVTAYKQSFGFDAPPFTYQDFEESDVLVFVGSNLCIAHPIMWQRVLRNRNRPEIIVIDPRRTETAMNATRHIALKPKTDLTLLYGLANLLIRMGAVKREFVDASTNGFDEFAAFVADFTPEKVSKTTGLVVAELEKIAGIIANGKRVSFWWTMGVNQGHEATRTAQAIINIALMTGNIGRPGTGANSVTGQCNAMGSRLFSNTTGLLGGHDFLNPQHRAKVAGILGIDEALVPTQNSLAYDQIMSGIESGRIKALWIIATNTGHSWIHQNSFRELRKKLEFLVVQDMFHSTETAQMADLYLPAAGWGEKDGTFINSERRIGRIRKVSKAPGVALSDFRIFRLIANAWGCGEMFKDWTSPEAVFRVMQQISVGQPCDFSGIEGYEMLEREGGVQWPLPAGAKPQKQRRLFEDGKFYHPDQKAKFLFEMPRRVAEDTSEDYPFILLTGRGTSSQWHTQTRTSKSDVLRKLYPEQCYVEMHPEDAARLRITENGRVLVRSRRGKLIATAFLTATVSRGQVFIPMHYATTNQLTYADFDPYSRQPSYKYCAVAIEKV